MSIGEMAMRYKWMPIAVIGFVVAIPAQAATCSVAAQDVAFGSYDSLARFAVDGVGNVNVSCDAPATFEIGIGEGGSGTFLQRRMDSGQSAMTYNLYTSAARTTVWGDGTGATTTVSDSGTGRDYTVYGRIDSGQNLPPGSYSDLLVVTVTY
jgi:spore coat protein U-like protein